MDKNAEIAAKLQALRDDYVARLAGELEGLAHLGLSLDVSVDNTEALTTLNQKLHKLAGSAGSFGLPALGRAAKELELQAADYLVNPDALQSAITQFCTAIQALQTLVVKATPPKFPSVSVTTPVNNQILIYVLEDDHDIAEEICITLRHFGHKVIHFSTLAAAEQEILRQIPDFMICDVMFSEEQREAPSAILALQKQLDMPIPVIFVSTRTDFNAYHSAVLAGAVGYFVKPLDIVRLVDCFEYYLDRNRSSPYRVLIIDDDKALGEHYRLVLNDADIRADVISDPALVFDVLKESSPELILMDLNMPDISGTELAQVIRLNQDWLKIPITYLSSESDVDRRISAMGRAGDDFLSKPLSDRELVAAVSARAARSRQLSDALDRDSLTGLLKHSRIKEQVDVEFSRAARTCSELSVVMLDLDKFKQINDNYGHAAGDKVIKALAHLLRQRLRKTDAIGRYGGEEFVAVLPNCGSTEALRLMEDVRQNFSEIVFTAEEKSFQVSLSAGIASFASGVTAPEQLLQHADKALYQAKAQGRNQVCLM